MKSHSEKKIVEDLKYLHSLRLSYEHEAGEETREDFSFYVFPSLNIQKKRKAPTNIEISVSTHLFRNMLWEEKIEKTDLFTEVIQFLRTRNAGKKSWENVYHTLFLEALERFKQNGPTFSVKDFCSFLAEKQKRKDFYKSCAAICTFFLERNYFENFTFNEEERVEYNISSKELVMIFDPEDNRKTMEGKGESFQNPSLKTLEKITNFEKEEKILQMNWKFKNVAVYSHPRAGFLELKIPAPYPLRSGGHQMFFL